MKALIYMVQLVNIYLLAIGSPDPFAHSAEISSPDILFYVIKFRQWNCENVPKNMLIYEIHDLESLIIIRVS